MSGEILPAAGLIRGSRPGSFAPENIFNLCIPPIYSVVILHFVCRNADLHKNKSQIMATGIPHKSRLLTTVMLLTIICWSCSSSKKTRTSASDSIDVVGYVGDTPVTYRQLLDQYTTSGSHEAFKKDSATYRDLSQFLDLYLTYRAKLLEARDAGYYQQKEIRDELDQYARQYAYTYWMDKRIRDELLDTLIARSKYDVHVSHILIVLPRDASPKDTLAAWNKLMEARREFLQGKPFPELVKEYATKRNGRSLGGDLGYISAGKTVKPFEDAAYNTPVDSISMPVRSQFGYHLIYVQGRRKHQPDRLVSHIFFRTDGKGRSISRAMKQADSVYSLLKNGASWNKMVQLSQDPPSRQQNGLIGWVNRRRYRPTFSDTVFSIRKLHTPYHPFYSGYGVHIIRIDSIRTFPDKKAERAFWLRELKRMPRYRNHKKYILEQAEKVGGAQVYAPAYDSLAELITRRDSIDLSHPELPQKLLAKPFYSINNQTYTGADFVKWLREERPDQRRFPHLYSRFSEFQDSLARKELVSVTGERFPKYKQEVQRYLDGLVVYKITDDSVWSYVRRDTTALRSLFASDSLKYWYPTRYKYYEITSDEDSTLNLAVHLLKNGVVPDSLNNHIGRKYLSVRENVASDPKAVSYQRLEKLHEGGVSSAFTVDGRHHVLYLNAIMKPRPMTFKEAYNQLSSDYLPIRKKEWLNRLHEKYNVHRAGPDHLKKAFWTKDPDEGS